MKIAQACQGDTPANLDQEGPNVKKKQQKYVMQTITHASAKIKGLAPGLIVLCGKNYLVTIRFLYFIVIC